MSSVKYDILSYLEALPLKKSSDLKSLHEYMVATYPREKLWFLDGKDASGKVVANPNIGYGATVLNYANGSQREFYRVGLSANTTGLSVYIVLHIGDVAGLGALNCILPLKFFSSRNVQITNKSANVLLWAGYPHCIGLFCFHLCCSELAC